VGIPVKTKIEDIMAIEVITVSPDTNIREASILMASHKIGAVLVTKDKSLVGMFSERDLLNRVVSKHIDPDFTLIKEIMSSPVTTITVGASINDALYVMTVKHIRHLPVVDAQGELKGMLGIRDLLDRFTVGNLWSTRSNFGFVFTLHALKINFKVKLTHTLDNGLI
jgi:CBS-domain-containing membrane protein